MPEYGHMSAAAIHQRTLDDLLAQVRSMRRQLNNIDRTLMDIPQRTQSAFGAADRIRWALAELENIAEDWGAR